jgi:5-methyltetrahydropteroyltriglutamate--homocysteine methyltransferase
MATERFLTTHTGSLPRPNAVLRNLADAESGHHVDEIATEALLAQAVSDCVDRQIAVGVDLVSDGEFSKPSYSTYVKDRLTGFGGEGSMPMPADLAEYPEYAKRVFGEGALRALKTPTCNAPIVYRGPRAVERDIERFRRALRGRKQGFLTAASPGVISIFLKNRHYPNREAYLGALADAMRVEYRAIHGAGFMLQIDCPDLAMGAHTEYARATLKELRRNLALHVEALNHAVADIPPERMRIHLCWGNYEGPHHRDVAIEEIVDIVLSARPAGLSFVAANPRHEHEWKIWQEVRVPEDKVLIPGVIDSTTNFIEHPDLVAERILRFARIVGDDRVIAGTDCGFSTFAGLHTVEPAITWTKLEALAEGARIAARARRVVGTRLAGSRDVLAQ